MKKAITAVECWGYDVFDIAIRRVQQLDRGMYPASIIFRLLLESDFAVSSFAGILRFNCRTFTVTTNAYFLSPKHFLRT
jgi:uncharacterized membrane protein